MTELSNADGTKSAAGGARNSRACRGRLDLVRHDLIEGWAQDEIHPRAPLRLNVIADGRILFEVLADQFREDLRAGGIGEGRHAFSVPVNPALSRTDRHRIEVRRADDGRPLPGSPQELPAQEAPTHVESEQELPEQPSPWHGNLDAVGRERLEGWAWDERAPGIPVALIVLDNGIPIARAIANAYRRDLMTGGIGDGRHAFTVTFPGGLSPLSGTSFKYWARRMDANCRGRRRSSKPRALSMQDSGRRSAPRSRRSPQERNTMRYSGFWPNRRNACCSGGRIWTHS